MGDSLAAESAAKELTCAVRDLQSRCLFKAAQWAAELLTSMPEEAIEAAASVQEVKNVEIETPQHMLARCLITAREYQRAATLLEGKRECLSPQARFLRHYAMYMAGEKTKEEDMTKLSDPLERCRVSNPYLLALHKELCVLYEEGALDGFGLYIYGVVLKEMKLLNFKQHGPVNAVSLLVESVRVYPWNWSAWLDLVSVLTEVRGSYTGFPPELETDSFSCSYMFDFFLQHLYLEQHQCVDAMNLIERQLQRFPESSYLLAQAALAHYAALQYDAAHELFLELQRKDPHRLEELDVFSNVLYVKGCKAELSNLAHTAVRIEKYRAETCCIIGNFYSLKGNHAKAVTYFSRALKVNRKFLGAWTLMGHEFVEMKNTGAAIEHYRRAVDINPKDYRAWYGLGQTYELLQMHLYAIYYYRRAAALRPYDSRMWCAMGLCFERLGRLPEAVQAYERAVANEDPEGHAMSQLAKLYSEAGKKTLAAQYYLKIVAGKELKEVPMPKGIEALLYLAYYYKDCRDYDLATQFASKLLDYAGPEKVEAMAILRQVRALEGHQESGVVNEGDTIIPPSAENSSTMSGISVNSFSLDLSP